MLPVGVARMRPSACIRGAFHFFNPGFRARGIREGKGKIGGEETYDGFGQVLGVYVGVDDAQVRISPAMERYLVHDLPAFSCVVPSARGASHREGGGGRMKAYR